MRLTDLGPLPLTLIASLVLAILLLVIRIFVMQRIQQRRQRENRQETERLKSLVAVYRSLAGSFSPGTGEHASQVEEALSEVVLFGSLRQVELAAQCINRIKAAQSPDYQALVEDLRTELRTQLGLEAIPPGLVLPASGPGRAARNSRADGEGGGRSESRGGGGGAAGAGGVGTGIVVADAAGSRDPA